MHFLIIRTAEVLSGLAAVLCSLLCSFTIIFLLREHMLRDTEYFMSRDSCAMSLPVAIFRFGNLDYFQGLMFNLNSP